MILNAEEMDALGKGKRKTVVIPEHERRRLYRTPQGVKDNTIEAFACRFTAQLDRFGCTKFDARHVNALITVLDRAVQRHQRHEAKGNRRSHAA